MKEEEYTEEELLKIQYELVEKLIKLNSIINSEAFKSYSKKDREELINLRNRIKFSAIDIVS